MTLPPWLVFALLVSLAGALIYQIGTRRFGWRLFAYWLLVLAGFLGAEVLAESAGWSITRFGDLRLFPDLVGALVIMLALWFLGL